MRVLLTMSVYGGKPLGTMESWKRKVDWPDDLPFPRPGDNHMIVFPNGDDEQSVTVDWIEYHPEAGVARPHAVFHCHSIPADENKLMWAFMADHYPGWDKEETHG